MMIRDGRLFGLRLVLGLTLWLGVASWAGGAEVLRFFTWEEYIDPDVLDEFGREHGVTVRTYFFNSDTDRDKALADTDGQGFDIITINGPAIGLYRKRDWLASLGAGWRASYGHLDARWREAYPEADGYAVPFSVGTLGILYRRDLVTGTPDSWKALLQPAPALCGRLTMGGDSRELLAVALKAAGASVNSTDTVDYQRAGQLLRGQKQCVAEYRYLKLDADSELVTGKIAAALGFSSDISMLRESDERIDYVVPREGTVLWVDFHAVLRSSPRAQLARDLLGFMHRPDIHARLAEYAGSMPTSEGARARLSPELRADPAMFPDDEVLQRSEFDLASPPEIARLRNAIYADVVRPRP